MTSISVTEPENSPPIASPPGSIYDRHSGRSWHRDQLTKDSEEIENALEQLTSRRKRSVVLGLAAEILRSETGLPAPSRLSAQWLMANLFRMSEESRATILNAALCCKEPFRE
jgi:hypothetical protein